MTKFVSPVFLAVLLMACAPVITPQPNPSPKVFLDPPASLNSVAGDQEVAVSWSTVDGAQGYNLYWSSTLPVTVSGGNKIGPVAGNLQSITGLPNGTKVYFVVTTLSADGEGQASAVAQAVPFRLRYVDVSGVDTATGSLSNPWRTLGHAASQVVADSGDTIVLGAGLFEEPNPISLPTGVNVRGKGVALTTIKYVGAAGRDFFLLKTDYHAVGNQEISDFTLDGNSKTVRKGISVLGRDKVWIHDLKIINCDENALEVAAQAKVGKEPDFYISDFRLSSVTTQECSKDWGSWVAGAISIAGLENAEIDHCVIEETQGYGIKFTLAYGGFRGIRIHDNTITANETTSKGFNFGIELWNVYDNSEVYNNVLNTGLSLVNYSRDSAGTISVKAYNNRIVGTRTDSPGQAIELAVSDGRVYNNYIEQFRWGVGVWQELAHDNWIYNNVITNPLPNTTIYDAGVYLEPTLMAPKTTQRNMVNQRIYNNTIDGFKNGIWMKAGSKQHLIDVIIEKNLFLNIRSEVIKSYEGVAYMTGMKVVDNAVFQSGPLWNSTPGVKVKPDDVVESGTLANDPLLDLSGAKPFPWYSYSSSSPVNLVGIGAQPW